MADLKIQAIDWDVVAEELENENFIPLIEYPFPVIRYGKIYNKITNNYTLILSFDGETDHIAIPPGESQVLDPGLFGRVFAPTIYVRVAEELDGNNIPDGFIQGFVGS